MEFTVLVRSKVQTLQNTGIVYFLHLTFTPAGIEATENGDGATANFKVTPEAWHSVNIGDEIKLGEIK